uniref:C3H1-type domain-containing protein n=1 Tax=Strigamia maritima TaxID=126957 RepID=T1IRX9_STRMM
MIASVRHIKFDIEFALEQQLGALPLPFAGMDKSRAAVCEFFTRSTCNKGAACPFQHLQSGRTVVCKHWLRGLCKKGDKCEFLHEFIPSKMPECYFYSNYKACTNNECPYLHIDPESKIKDCPWYDRGCCRHGPNCRQRHSRKILCESYLIGFCIEGASCKFAHPKFELPTLDPAKRSNVVCHYCSEAGHKANFCNKRCVETEIREQRHEKPFIVAQQNYQARNYQGQKKYSKLSGSKKYSKLSGSKCSKSNETTISTIGSSHVL